MKAYTNGKIFTGKTILQNHCVITEHSKVVDIINDAAIPSHAERIDLNGNLLTASFIDLQIYGGNDAFFGEFPSVETLQTTYEYCLSGGAAHFLPTVATHSEEVMFNAIEAVKTYWEQGGREVLGLHLEGPYINIEKRGAHLKQFIKIPTLKNVKDLLSKGEGIIKMMTLAPEVCSDEVLELLLKQDIVISAGHTNATYEQATKSFQKGIKVATHLFNAMSPLQHRAPGMVGAIYDAENVTVSLVADGHHVDFAAIRISKKLLNERLFLITDAVTENLKGHYTHQLQKNKYTLADGTLSGSSLTMLQAVKNCVEKVGISLEEALRMASLYPARVIKMERNIGSICKDCEANFITLDSDLNLIAIYTDKTES